MTSRILVLGRALYSPIIFTYYKSVFRVLKENLEYPDFQELTELRDTLEILECLVQREILGLQGLKDLWGFLDRGGSKETKEREETQATKAIKETEVPTARKGTSE